MFSMTMANSPSSDFDKVLHIGSVFDFADDHFLSVGTPGETAFGELFSNNIDPSVLRIPSDPALLEDGDIFPPASACTPPEQSEYHYRASFDESRFSTEPEDFSPSLETDRLFERLVTEDMADEAEEEEEEDEDDLRFPQSTYPLVRGASTGGGAPKPPKEDGHSAKHHYLRAQVHIQNAQVRDICRPEWDSNEKEDRRRIVRIERIQRGAKIYAKFSIVGSALDHPEPELEDEDTLRNYVEVSCLECREQEHGVTDYYITSVEVIKIVELLIGTDNKDAQDRRRERGRIRSNLVPFWSKRPIRSKKANSPNAANSVGSSASSSSGDDMENGEDSDYRTELAQRIMGYKTRKPRGFDKEVRIMKWSKLVSALERALQTYYVQFPANEFDS